MVKVRARVVRVRARVVRVRVRATVSTKPSISTRSWWRVVGLGLGLRLGLGFMTNY